MKLIALFFTAILAISCGSKRTSVAESPKSITTSQCPENGTCTFEVLKEKVLNIQSDEFGNLYPEIVEGDAIVLKFEFQRNAIPDTVDGDYRELIYLQLDSKNPELQLENIDLKTAKVLFGRLCFCRGQTGYYKIDNGSLSVIKSDVDVYELQLNFKCDAVPQIMTQLSETFKL